MGFKALSFHDILVVNKCLNVQNILIFKWDVTKVVQKISKIHEKPPLNTFQTNIFQHICVSYFHKTISFLFYVVKKGKGFSKRVMLLQRKFDEIREYSSPGKSGEFTVVKKNRSGLTVKGPSSPNASPILRLRQQTVHCRRERSGPFCETI